MALLSANNWYSGAKRMEKPISFGYMSEHRFQVRPEKEEELNRMMADLKLSETDIEETFLLPGTKGGQNANKNATKVRLLHKPTGIQVSCKKSRSQNLNRFLARRLLVQKIQSMQNQFSDRPFQSDTEKVVAKIRKQKAKQRKRHLQKHATEPNE